MKTNEKRMNGPIIVWGIVIVIMFICTVLSGNFTWQNSWITLLMLGIMAFFIIAGQLRGLNPLRNMTKSIHNVCVRIEEMKNNKELILWEQLRKEQFLFENKELDRMFDAYKYEMDRLYREHEENIQCDIAEYINEDNVGEAIHVHFLEQLSGIMTGLGILGTFIGLALGLSQFRNDGVDQMISSIAPLIDGIKVAFYTSIYGVILSLGFNVYYKSCQGRFNKNLEEFYDIFYKYVTHVPANDMANQLLHYQQSQALAMEQFSETISVQFAKSFEQFAAPTFEKIGDTMTNLSQHMVHTLQTLSDQISNKQKESMEEIVENFISQMNISLGGSFEQLKSTIDNLCEGQKETAEKVNGLLEHLSTTIQEINQIHEVSENIVKNLEAYSGQLNSYQANVNEAYAHVQQQEAMFADITNQQQACLDSFSNHEAALVSNISELGNRTKEILQIFRTHTDRLEQCSKEIMQVLETSIEKSSQSTEQQIDLLKDIYQEFADDLENTAQKQIENVKDIYQKFVVALDNTAKEHMEQNKLALGQMVASLDKSSSNLSHIADGFQGNLKGSIDRTFEQFDTNLSEIAMCLSGTIAEINDTTENIPKALRGIFVTMQKQLEEYIKTIAQLQEESKDALDKMKQLEQKAGQEEEGVSQVENEVVTADEA